MQNNSLIFGIAGFLLGGLVVSIAATTFDKPAEKTTATNNEMTMSEMTTSLQRKAGDDFDKTFIAHMIEHHESAVAMAKLSPNRAKHAEINQLSKEIITAQQQEISAMKQWQKDWGYSSEMPHKSMTNEEHGVQ